MNRLEMSIVLVTRTTFASIRKTVRHLSRQTAKDQLELLIVAPSREELALADGEVQGFGSVKVIEVGTIVSMSQAKLSAVRQATAPVVAFAEDHCYPEPEWAENLIKAHQGPWAAVGPLFQNANPNSLNSWASYLMSYVHWHEPIASGPADSLPWHNTSYKRECLLEFDGELAALLCPERFLQEKLLERGHKFFLSRKAMVRHVNVSMLSSVLSHSYVGGRLFGAQRAFYGKWSPWRRLLHIGSTPLVPLVRLRRTYRDIHRIGEGKRLLPGVLPILFLGLASHVLGEMVGLAFGMGDADKRFSIYELSRIDHLTERDRQVELAG